jgi:hypothetical protein
MCSPAPIPSELAGSALDLLGDTSEQVQALMDDLTIRGDQAVRSKRSRFMTLFHAATKSRVNASFESSQA